MVQTTGGPIRLQVPVLRQAAALDNVRQYIRVGSKSPVSCQILRQDLAECEISPGVGTQILVEFLQDDGQWVQAGTASYEAPVVAQVVEDPDSAEALMLSGNGFGPASASDQL